jgi:hypothetical protein
MADTIITDPFWPCEDVWPPGTIRRPAMMAYRMLHDRGLIAIDKVIYNARTCVTRVRYLSLFWGADLIALLRQTEGEACLIMAEYYWAEKERESA